MSTPSGKSDEEQVIPFVKPNEEQVAQWYKWVSGLSNKQSPFDPSDEGRSWDANNNNGPLIWLAAVTATTEPAYKESDIPELDAIVAGSGGKVVFNDGKGNPVQKLPPIKPRVIPKSKGGNRDFYIPVCTEIATAKKYPKQANRLSETAQRIIDKEEADVGPTAFVQFVNADKKEYSLNGPEVKERFRVNSTKDITFNAKDGDNVFMLPSGEGPAAFSDLSVILSRDALKPGENRLKFGLKGKFFAYEVEYMIDV
jgi:hypothetical protein